MESLRNLQGIHEREVFSQKCIGTTDFGIPMIKDDVE